MGLFIFLSVYRSYFKIISMEELGKHVNPYRGLLICFIVMIAAPVAGFLIIQRYMDIYLAIGLSGTIGFCFTVICWICGFLRGLFQALIDRVRETRDFYGGIFNKEGFKWYFTRFFEDGGIIIYLFFLLMLTYVGLAIFGFVKSYEFNKDWIDQYGSMYYR